METPVIIAIIIAIVAVLAFVGVTGYVLSRKRRISLSETEAAEQVTDGSQRQVDRSGGYKAESGFSFSQGGAGSATLERDEHPAVVPPTGPTVCEPPVVEDAVVEEPVVEAPVVETPVGESPVAETPVVETPAVEVPVEAPVDESVAPEVEPEIVDEVPEVAPELATPALDEIDPTEGRLSRLRGRLARSQGAIGASVLGLLGAGDLDEDSWEEIEDTLVMADLGTAATATVTENLRGELASGKVRTAADARAALKRVLVEQLRPELDRSVKALPHAGGPAVVLVVGVNGVGKTTTTGKLARVLVADGRRVLLGAADTFRAAAADQLQTWGERVGASIVRGKEGADPASVAFDAVSTGISEGVDVVLIDTAGRLHTKTGLMDELGKVKRVVEKKAKVDEVLLVLDATVGQNGLMQAKVFAEVVDLTGVVLTKLDGTAKGGIVFRIQEELGVPVKLVGLGEGADDLAPFVPEAFVDALL
ncbi:signal recognition particle-docking protein FtsY [Gordonia sp. (in: high G+C Gram-positive bacteria)]|uniref:signal recognition particle-docking protein FtsY n=1 Tax=Gordonia sp. (in: high G+C Gram-positive bacteria) TaxID=84139 RepID=UPI003C741AFE